MRQPERGTRKSHKFCLTHCPTAGREQQGISTERAGKDNSKEKRRRGTKNKKKLTAKQSSRQVSHGRKKAAKKGHKCHP
jgi:hypothetical protein